MKIQHTTKTINLCKSIFALTTLLVALLPVLGKAGSLATKNEQTGKAASLVIQQPCLRVTNRPLTDFLNAQGMSKNHNPPQFFPDVKDYVGFSDAVDPGTGLPTTFALVDYAGLADKYIKAETGRSLGTKVNGLVTECRLANGKAKITVALFTTQALGFAQSIAALAGNNFVFLNTPTIFGAKAQDVVNGAAAAVGPATLLASFSIPRPGAALPDFLDVAENSAIYAPVKLNFTSITAGKCADGRKALLNVHQEAATNGAGELIYSTEIIKAVGIDGRNCGG